MIKGYYKGKDKVESITKEDDHHTIVGCVTKFANPFIIHGLKFDKW